MTRDAGPPVGAAVAAAIREAHPEVETWDVQVIPAQGMLRVLIDREGGVDLALCESVSRALAPFRERYGLEVSSPGLERPLVQPSHYARFVGSRVKLRLRERVDGRRAIDGLIVATDAESVRILPEGQESELVVPYAAVQRANLVWNPVNAT